MNVPDTTQPPTQQQPKLDTRALLVIIGVVVVVGILLFGSRLFGTGTDQSTPVPTEPAAADDNIQLGEIVAAENIDRDGCPVNVTSSFDGSDSVYVVMQNATMPAGTSVFARLHFEGQPIEDTDPIVADRDYTDTCIYFVFEAGDAADVLESGNYEAEFIVNGNPDGTVTFEVR